MKCRQVQRWLSKYHDGHPLGREANGVAAHLRGCSECRQQRDRLILVDREVRERVGTLLQRGGNVRQRVMDHWLAEQAAAPRAPWPRLLPWSRSEAKLCLLVLSVVAAVMSFFYPAGREQSRQDGRQDRQAAQAVSKEQSLRIQHALPPSIPSRHGRKGVPERRARRGRQGKGSSGPAGFDEHGRGSPTPRQQAPDEDDLKYWNRDPAIANRQWAAASVDEWDQIEAKVRAAIRARDDFVQIPFVRLASTSERQIAQAVESYKREAAIVDPRLSREVTCAFKATALSGLCDQLRNDTGIRLSAGSSVADEKVTVFCEKLPLREVMRRLSRPFGYTWLRSNKEGGDYRYELVQDLRSQLLEEELRNRDRDEALLDLDREMNRYRPYLDLSPDEALARIPKQNGGQEEVSGAQQLLSRLAHEGWGPVQMYFRLSPRDLAALRSGQGLTFSTEPQAGQQPLPADLARGVLQSVRELRLIKDDHGFRSTPNLNDPNGLPLTAFPEVGAQLSLKMDQNELGQFTLSGESGFFVPRRQLDGLLSGPAGKALAIGMSRAVTEPENRLVNARLAHDPSLRARVSIRPQPSCGGAGGQASDVTPALPPKGSHSPGSRGTPEGSEKVTTADVLEALHHATGFPIVADFYTHLYPSLAVSALNQSLFDALNQLTGTMILRWNKEGAWLQFRSATFYHDRLKEVPNRFLNRWAAARRAHGGLTLDDLIEVAQLSDAQLDAAAMAEGACDCFGLVEWDLARARRFRPHLRFLAELTPAQRQEATSGAGLAFTTLSRAQQQQLIDGAFSGQAPLPLAELLTTTLRVDYTQPGWFQWGQTEPANYLHWVVPLSPDPQGRHLLRPPVRERTRAAAAQAVRQVDPQIRQALRQIALRANTGLPAATGAVEEELIVPTKLDLGFAYITSAGRVFVVSNGWVGFP